MQPEQLMTLRRADMRTASILMIVSAFAIIESLSFPLTGNYAGVQNVWYVSPALFPIIISCLVFLCGAALLIKSIIFIKQNAAIGTAKESPASWWRFFVLVSLIAGQVYGFVPLIDFALSSFIFLFVFIFAFYSDNSTFQKRIFAIWTVVCVLLASVTFSTNLTDETRSLFDWTALVFIVCMIVTLYKWAKKSEQLKVWKVSWKTALIVTLVVCPVFRLGMLVPLPTEGIVINPMVDIKYVVRDFWREM
ncbi:tripartite tricarboxylate transporter TctB family protein [Marinomonas colpomeniae]|uniref:Tripartite tricarboxylate transporter TctB family protein n=1 Tax=Marinomonas colpomeniae TaxID=2774408 RepID=A0ABR8NVB6_9GAMM|nr:tripartite tricarboxylate transporter TctB family protein [Marinomonas colpomeniae]MBD5769996.1 tripartite tricarboxylate transporter TctB family protein [Marinomonas colpomeniae]